MSTKAQMIAKFQEVYTANPDITDWVEVEQTLHTDPASILENIYGDGVNDDEVSQTYTVSNSRFDYNVTLRKIGSSIILTGDFTVNAFAPSNVTLFSISNTDFNCVAKNFICSTSSSTGESGALRIINGVLFTRTSFVQGETHNFTMIYTALN